MSNNITKTIKESLEEFDKNVNELRRDFGPEIEGKENIYLFGYKEQRENEFFTVPDWGNIKSHLLQSQIRLIDVFLQQLEEGKACIFESDGEYHSCVQGCEGLVENCQKCHRDRCSNKQCPLGKGIDNNSVRNQVLEDQISSLEEVKKLIENL